MKADRQFVTALARGLEVLRCFTLERPELTISEIAALTELPQPTVWRLCYTLSKLDYLVRGETGERLRVAPGVLTLGHAPIANAGVAEFAYPLMRRIADEFQATVSLAARDRLTMVIVQRAEARSILRLNLSIGSTLDIATSALGWSYLAAIPEADRDALLQALRSASPEHFDRHIADIRAAMETFSECGHVFNLKKFHPDVNAIGVPVVAADKRTVMAVNCGGASSIVTKEKLAGPIARALKRLAADIAWAVAEDPADSSARAGGSGA